MAGCGSTTRYLPSRGRAAEAHGPKCGNVVRRGDRTLGPLRRLVVRFFGYRAVDYRDQLHALVLGEEIPEFTDMSRTDVAQFARSSDRIDPDATTETGRSLLGEAIHSNKGQIAEMLLYIGASVDQGYADPMGGQVTPLEAAARDLKAWAVKLLLGHGAAPLPLDQGVMPALRARLVDDDTMQAFDRKQVVEIVALLEKAAGVDPTRDRWIDELIAIGRVPKITVGAESERFYWLPPGQGIGPVEQWDPRVREIGAALHLHGARSVREMQIAHQAVVDALGGMAGHALSAQWHGIGEEDETGDVWYH